MLALLVVAALFATERPKPIDFQGRVVRAEDRSPVAGARVEVGAWSSDRKIAQFRAAGQFEGELPPLPPLPSTTTGADGRFRIAVDSALRAWVTVTAPGLGAAASDWSAGQGATEVVFALHRAARLELDVALEEDGPPGMSELTARVDGSLYAASCPQWLPVFGPRTHHEFTARADPRAPFVLDGLPSRVPLDLHVLIDGRPVIPREQETFVLAPGEVRRIPWPEPATGAGHLRVEVRDARGEAVAGVPVAIGRPCAGRHAELDRGSAEHVTTDATGAARLGGLRPGHYVVDLGRDVCASAVAVRVDYTKEAVATLVAEPARVLEGSVVDSDGAPIVGAWIDFTRVGAEEREIAVQSDADGHFALPGVPRDGHGVLRAGHSSVAVREVVLAAPMADEGSAQIRFPVAVALRVRVLDAAGVPVAASIRHQPRNVISLLLGSVDETETTAELAPGPRRVSAVTRDGRVASAAVDVGTTSEVVLRVAAAGSVRMRHRGVERFLNVVVEDEAGLALGLEQVHNGYDSVVLLPPGVWIVRAPGRPQQRVLVEAGLETLVRF